MTIKIDHINLDRSKDPGFWYLWALDFNNTFRFLFVHLEESLRSNLHNLETDPPPPATTVMWHIYVHALELYMKTYLLATKAVEVEELKSIKYRHDLEKLRRKCAEAELKFNDESLVWITQEVQKSMRGLDWEFIKYPPKRPPLSQKPKIRDAQALPAMYGRKTMIPPLDQLEDIVKPLVYTKD